MDELYPTEELNNRALSLLTSFLTPERISTFNNYISPFIMARYRRYHGYMFYNGMLGGGVPNQPIDTNDVSTLYVLFRRFYDFIFDKANSFNSYINDTYKLPTITEEPPVQPVGRRGQRLPDFIKNILQENQERTLAEFKVTASTSFESYIADLKVLLDNIVNLYASTGFVFHYFSFMNQISPYYIINKHGIEPAPETYELVSTLSSSGAGIIVQDLSKSFFPNLVNHMIDYRISRNYDYLTYKGSRIGWSKTSLMNVLIKNGIFDFIELRFGNKVAWTMPKLQALGITPDAGPVPQLKSARDRQIRRGDLISKEGINYPSFIQYIPKYALEALYRITVNPKPDWLRLCRSNISTARSIQAAVERVLKIQISGDKIQTCAALQGILTTMAAREEISEVAPALISQPGGVQYLKYRPQGAVGYSIPEARRINVKQWYEDVERICHDESKTWDDAYNLALKLELGAYVTRSMTKPDICKVMINYLNLLEQGRTL